MSKNTDKGEYGDESGSENGADIQAKKIEEQELERQEMKEITKNVLDDPQGLGLDPLDELSDGMDDNAILEAGIQTYNDIIDPIVKTTVKEHPFFKDFGKMQQLALPTDPSAALLECQGTYYLHLAFFLVIQFMVVEQSDEVYCYKQIGQENWLWNSKSVPGIDEPEHWKLRDGKPHASVLNKAVKELMWAHIACFGLLLLARLYYFQNVGKFSLSMQSVIRLISIPIYLVTLYRAEFAVRQYRPNYSPDTTWTNIWLRNYKDSNSQKGAQFCVALKEGNVFQWIWVELIAFQSNLVVMGIQLLIAYCSSTKVKEPKNPDMIMVKDYRSSDLVSKFLGPSIHVFNLKMEEILNVSPKPFKWENGTKEDEQTGLDRPFSWSEKLALEEQTFNKKNKKSKSDNEGTLVSWQDRKDQLKQEEEQKITRKIDLVRATFKEKPKKYDFDGDDEAYEKAMKEYNKIKAFRIKGTDVDDEVLEIINDQDLLFYIRGSGQDIQRIAAYLGIISVYIFFAYTMCYPSKADKHITRSMITAFVGRDKANGGLPDEFKKKNYCILDYPEDAYKKPLSAFIVMHLAVYFIGKMWWILNSSYKQMMTTGHDRLFKSTYPKAAVMLIVIYALAAGAAWILKGQVTWETKSTCSHELRATRSIMCLWMVTDVIICITSVFSLYTDFWLGRNQEVMLKRQMIYYCHRNALKKFHDTDAYAKTLGAEAFSLEGKLTSNIQRVEVTKLTGQPDTSEITPEEKDYRFRERNAANLRRQQVSDLCENLDGAIAQLNGFQENSDLKRAMKAVNANQTEEEQLAEKVKEKEEEVATNVSQMIKTVPLEGGSFYDYVFWFMYNEDNPVTLGMVKAKCTLTIGVHCMVIYFNYLVDLSFLSNAPYYGDYSINVVRAICVLLLQLQMYKKIEGAIGMLTFLVSNPEKFACGSLIFPGAVAFYKMFIFLVLHISQVMKIMQINNELATIGSYLICTFVAVIDGRLMNILNADPGGCFSSKPMEFLAVGYSSLESANHFSKKVKEQKIKKDWTDVLIVWICALIVKFMQFFYVTFYYYFLPFVPFAMVMIESFEFRNSPHKLKNQVI